MGTGQWVQVSERVGSLLGLQCDRDFAGAGHYLDEGAGHPGAGEKKTPIKLLYSIRSIKSFHSAVHIYMYTLLLTLQVRHFFSSIVHTIGAVLLYIYCTIQALQGRIHTLAGSLKT